MRVPGETAQRRLIRRPWLTVLIASAAALTLYLFAPLPAPSVAAPSAGDCVELTLWTNGYHSDIGAPAEIFPAAHPLRRLYPAATSFLIGWGDEAFYRSDGRNMWLGVDAVIPPSRAALHIAHNAREATRYFGPNDEITFGVSREGAARFVAFVDRALVLDDQGAPIRIGPGKVANADFLRANGVFHLFYVCNHWMARALRDAGLNLNTRTPWFGDGLMAEVRAARPPTCR